MKSILAGAMISLGALAYLSIGGIAGAIFFSIGLLAVLVFQFELFTGKAGLLATQQITLKKLVAIWLGNFIGTFIIALIALMTPQNETFIQGASNILAVRLTNSQLENFVNGIFCGMLMYLAVTMFQTSNGKHPLYAMMPVAIFILCGFNHCVADMFYTHMSCTHLTDYWTLIPTTVGNLVGCCIIPYCQSFYSSSVSN